VTEILELTIERPVAGGRMLARHDGRIVFVSGAIPGERVRAKVERTTKQSWFAATVDVMERSPDRRDTVGDPACGGCTFAHIQYDRQRELKQQILVDAFRRLGRVELESPPAVAPSPEHGYRLRARLHAGGGRLGFYREGTHTLCDAAPTGQVRAESLAAAQTVFEALGPRGAECEAVVIAENVAGTERVIHLEPRAGARVEDAWAAGAGGEAATGLQASQTTGVTTLVRGALRPLWGRNGVTDRAETLFGGASPWSLPVVWTRRAPAFFQGNRYLLGALVGRVVAASDADCVVDLYAGVGLFSVALAAGGARVVAVEGEPFAAADLKGNAQPWGGRLRVVEAAVEDVVLDPPDEAPDAVVVDPPRTGASAAAIEGIAAWRAPRVVYVSCDPPTLARDAARLIARGYRLDALEAFDMFPNTPHVEAVAVFAR